MAIRDTMRRKATHVLQPDEPVQAIFPAQTMSSWVLVPLWWITIFKNCYRVVVVTDRRILLCQSGRFFSVTAVTAILAEFPRDTRIGPASGLTYRCDVLGERLYVRRRFYKDIATADELRLGEPAVAGATPN